jgi:hypothetical protein
MTINTIDTSLTSTTLTIQQSTETQSVGALVGGNAPGASGAVQQAVSTSGDSAHISGPGQLLGQLQQLQAQDPTKFKQLVSDIASQLQAAAQQTTGIQANFLSELAGKFQTAATTGNVSSLLPNHHGHHVHGTYNAQGQVTPSALPGVAPTTDTSSTTAASGTNIGQLFANIAKEISQAVGAGTA